MSPSAIKPSFAVGEDLPAPVETLHDLYTNAALNNKTKTALVCLHQPSSLLSSITKSAQGDCLKWTFEELSRASHAFAQSLTAAGVRPGMRIAAFLYIGAEYHVILRAALELNCAFSPLNPATLKNVKEARHVIELVGPSVLIAPDMELARMIDDAAPDIAQKALVKLFNERGSARLDGWDELEPFTVKWDGKDRIQT
jgi:acyl-CoA synthetase (AMP-forming)/AMP-acid ligase II